MVSWPPEWQQKLIDALTRAGADGPCSRCGNEDFNLLDGYLSLPIQAKLSEGPASSVSTVATVCERCGFLSMHVVNVLMATEMEATRDPSPGEGRNN